MEMQSEGNEVPIETNDPWQQEALRRSEEQKKRMEKLEPISSKGRYLVGSIVLGLLFYFCFHDYYINIAGLVYPLFLVGLYVITWKTMKSQEIVFDKHCLSYVICSFLLAISTVLTTNFLIIFLNTVGIIILYLITLCRCYLVNKEMGMQGYIMTIGKCISGAFVCSKFFFKHTKGKIRIKRANSEKSKNIILGILLAIVFLVVVLPLLIQADPVFRNILISPFQAIHITNIDQIIKGICFIFIPAILFYGLMCSCYIRYMEVEEKQYSLWKPDAIIIMTGIIAVTYILFCSIQITYLFGGLFELPEGITYAEYARQGFLQLLCVAVINTLLVLLLKIKCSPSKILNHILLVLSICTGVMIISSAYRMILYVKAYNLTRLRILVLWFLVLLVFVIGQIIYYIYHSKFRIGKWLFTTGLVAYIILSFGRMDYVIAKYNISVNEDITLYNFMYLTELSLDAAPAIAELSKERLVEGQEDMEYYYDYSADIKTEYRKYFIRIKNEYNTSIRGFNISSYLAYQSALNNVSEWR